MFYYNRYEYLIVSIVLTIISEGINFSEISSVLSIKSFQLTHYPSVPPDLVEYL